MSQIGSRYSLRLLVGRIAGGDVRIAGCIRSGRAAD